MIYFGYLIALIIGGFAGCYFCPKRDDAMIKEAQRCRAELKQANKEYSVLSSDYAYELEENARLLKKLAERYRHEK